MGSRPIPGINLEGSAQMKKKINFAFAAAAAAVNL